MWGYKNWSTGEMSGAFPSQVTAKVKGRWSCGGSSCLVCLEIPIFVTDSLPYYNKLHFSLPCPALEKDWLIQHLLNQQKMRFFHLIQSLDFFLIHSTKKLIDFILISSKKVRSQMASFGASSKPTAHSDSLQKTCNSNRIHHIRFGSTTVICCNALSCCSKFSCRSHN